MSSIFEKMIEDFSKKDTASLLEECMNLNAKKMKKIPVRYRLIAVGFVSHMSLEQLNDKLEKNGCEKLYARNPVEASLIFAFQNGLSYQEWSRLEKLCEKLISRKGMEDPWFNHPRVTYRELEDYIRENSRQEGGQMNTGMVTQFLKKELEGKRTEQEFMEFMERNWSRFRPVREKARYYYCKYLSYYIEEKTEEYLNARKAGFGQEQAFMELNVLKGISKLQRTRYEDTELRQELREYSISFGNIYNAFNQFYFGYISMDWMEVLMESYSFDIDRMSPEDRRSFASAIRSYEDGWDDLSDEEVIRKKWQQAEERERELDMEYQRGEGEEEKLSARGYQKNRSGEKSVRGYIKGTVDLDRTTLIFYLLFMGRNLSLHKDMEITRERLDDILEKCSYGKLRDEDEFDHFLIEYLSSEDPVGYMMESVTEVAKKEKNFYLYHMYQGASSEDVTLKGLLK